MAAMEKPRVIDGATGEVIADPPVAVQGADAPFAILDPYAPTGVRRTAPNADWIATISAGHKEKTTNGTEYPKASTDGTIYLHDPESRAPKLAEALKEAGGKSLTITFPYDDLGGFIHQHFTRRSASALQVYGDQYRLTEIVLEEDIGPDGKQRKDREGKALFRPVHRHHYAGSQRYHELLTTCKAEVTVLFALARWIVTPDGPRSEVEFPDGFAWYRLRFTSRHSLNSIVGKLVEVREKITGGKIAGLPFTLSIAYRDVPGPDGKTRRIPVWVLDFKPPETIKLTSGNMRGVLGQAIAEGEKLKLLPRPRELTIEDAAVDDDDFDMDTLEVLTNQAPPARVRYWENSWFGAVKDTELDDRTARARFIQRYTEDLHPNEPERWTNSLATFLASATEADASGLIAAVSRKLDRERTEAIRDRMRDAIQAVAPPAAPPTEAPERAPLEDPSMDAPAAEPATDEPTRPPDDTPDEPSDVAYGDVMPSAEQMSDYAALMGRAGAAGIDLAPYETDTSWTLSELTAKTERLEEALAAALAAAAPTATPAPPKTEPKQAPPAGFVGATLAQIQMIERLAGPTMMAELHRLYGEDLATLSKRDASQAIDKLRAGLK